MNEQQFYAGAGGARGSIVTDPNDLPRWIVEDAPTLTVTGPTAYTSAFSAFWTALDRAGAVANITAANTWTSVVNLTGAGLLGNVVANHGAFTGAKTIGIRIEVDGVLWEWMDSITTTGNTGTLLVGAVARPAGGNAGLFPAANRSIESADALANGSPDLVTTTALLATGAPVLAFGQSLKVWVRNSRVGASSQGQQAGCTYVMR